MRIIGLIHGRQVVKWLGLYFVNPVPYCGGILREDPCFKTLREVFAAKEYLEQIARDYYGYGR